MDHFSNKKGFPADCKIHLNCKNDVRGWCDLTVTVIFDCLIDLYYFKRTLNSDVTLSILTRFSAITLPFASTSSRQLSLYLHTLYFPLQLFSLVLFRRFYSFSISKCFPSVLIPAFPSMILLSFLTLSNWSSAAMTRRFMRPLRVIWSAGWKVQVQGLSLSHYK